ncbi:uncharacterized protein ARMOST_00356 [Armillaria ostoyae]|uniref:Cytochrome P450 CYP2 subfamily n=1 Tax=Armillaria ostoyae TaxID=47428 RepID=A0A284QKU8_ARMOS|nr:uncharacterized protein ARMOST_00356 [Armillaria ostoyae]
MYWTGMSSTTLVVDTTLFLVAVVVVRKLYSRRLNNSLGLPYPPGPTPSIVPFVGNIYDMPIKEEWFKFTEWGKQYGPLVMLEVMGQKMCIINTIRAATDLLDARSAIYSDRPQMRMVRELMGWEFNVGFQSYGAKYKKSRKLFHHGFNPRASDAYQPIQTAAFGYQTVKNDEFVRIAEEAQLAMVSAARPGAYLVDFIPFLKYIPEWFPGAHFQRVAREGRDLAEDLQNKPYAWARKQFDEGKAKPSFFRSIMEAKGLCSDDPVEEEQLIKKASALMYATGADTILASVLNFFLGMLHAPDVQKKAQEELSRVVGNDRLPTFADRASLPYIECIVKETLRWEQVTPLGVPHRLMKDDSHDESMYPDPMTFRPERFMDASAAKDEGPCDPNTIAFGWGRRICPGRFLAENSLWLHVATTLACFNISPIIGSDGRPVIPPRDYTSGLASRPKPFSCHVLPRNLGVVELIRDSVASVESQ